MGIGYGLAASRVLGPMGTGANMQALTEADDFSGLQWWLGGGSGYYTDTGGTTPASPTDTVRRISDRSGAGRNVTNASSSITLQSVTNGSKTFTAALGDGTSTGVLSHNTKSDWIFLHDGTAFTIVFAIKIVGANPDAATGVLGTNGGASASIGVSVFPDDRSSQAVNDTIRFQQTKGVAGQSNLVYVAADGSLPSNAWRIVSYHFQNGIAGNDLTLRVNGVDVGGADTTFLPHSSASPTYDMQLFSVGNGVVPGNIYIAELAVYNVKLAAGDLSALETAWAAKYGITLP